VASAAVLLGLSAKAAQRHIDRLVEAEVLEEVTEGQYARIWAATPILAIAEE